MILGSRGEDEIKMGLGRAVANMRSKVLVRGIGTRVRSWKCDEVDVKNTEKVETQKRRSVQERARLSAIIGGDARTATMVRGRARERAASVRAHP